MRGSPARAEGLACTATLPPLVKSSSADPGRQPQSWTCKHGALLPPGLGSGSSPSPALETTCWEEAALVLTWESCKGKSGSLRSRHSDTRGSLSNTSGDESLHGGASPTENVHSASMDSRMQSNWDETQLRPSWSKLAGQLPVLSGPRKWGPCTGALFAASANPVTCPQSGAFPTRVNCSRQLSGRWKLRLPREAAQTSLTVCFEASSAAPEP